MSSTIRLASLLFLAVPALAQVPMWGQCGGIGWTGGTTCVSGASCNKLNDYYYQCLAGGPATTAAPPPPVTTTTTQVQPPPVSSTTTTPSNPGPTSSPGTCPPFGNPTFGSVAALPDPFLKIGGGRISTKAEWACRREEISQLFQRDELGTFPPKPSSVTASFSGSSLSITASEGGKSISFSVSVSLPSGNGPFPAIIAYGALSIPRPNNVAVITFNNDDIAAQQNSGSRGQGKFYTLYGSGHSASALTAWAWGVGRIIDGIELTQASIKIDPKRVAVTGCSRNGKGAIVAGAFETRVALTIPQESGSGGAACWRLSDAQKAAGKNVQTASQIITENVWMSKSFESYVNRIPSLPIDHHQLAGLIAPRGLLVIENTGMEWLGNESTNGCMRAGRKIYQALGVADSMGFSQVGGNNHCSFNSAQQPELTAFINRFLLNQSANTNVVKTDGSYTFDENRWTPWTVPTLS